VATYYARVHCKGTAKYGELSNAFGVHDSPAPCLPVGVGFEVGRTEEGLALFRLTVRNVGVPGRFILVDGEFRPVE
jgi:hypothetical protein